VGPRSMEVTMTRAGVEHVDVAANSPCWGVTISALCSAGLKIVEEEAGIDEPRHSNWTARSGRRPRSRQGPGRRRWCGHASRSRRELEEGAWRWGDLRGWAWGGL